VPATDGSTVIAPGNFRDELIAQGLLIETGVPGVYGRSAEFEDTVERIDRRVSGRSARPIDRRSCGFHRSLTALTLKRAATSSRSRT
jgi:hypothetical protein